jgi:2TM domain
VRVEASARGIAMPANPVDRRNPRLRGFINHLVVYFIVMIWLVAINLMTAPENPWFVWPLIGWMAPVAIHAAYAMHLIGKRKE